LRGARLLEEAAVVVYDPEIDREVLGLAPGTAELLSADVAPKGIVSNGQVLVAKAREGKRVVRLMAGDTRDHPQVAEEVRALTEGGVAFELVPGIAAEPASPTPPARETATKKGPLAGQRVVVTRSREQAGGFSIRLQEQGAEVVEVPVIKLAPPDDRKPLSDALLGLHEYDWLVFTSLNGVNTFFDYFFKGFQDLRDLGGVRIAAVGPVTAARLRELHLTVDAMPSEALGKKVAKAMAEQGSLENLRVCLLRAQAANPELPKLLESEGAIVDDVACYKTVAETEDADGTAGQLVSLGADWLTFTSGSTVEHFHARFNLPELLRKFPKMRIASIGPETSKALTALSLKPDVEAREHTAEGLLKAMSMPAP
jgi:uroporphyrinogen-III synthase